MPSRGRPKTRPLPSEDPLHREFRRPDHRLVAEVRHAMDAQFLEHAGCFLAGGARLTLPLDEYRECRNIVFLFSARSGLRALRETVTADSLGALLRRPLPLARDVRADRDGVRTSIAIGGIRLKLEIVFEGRIDLDGALDARLAVPVLDPKHAVAEKLLANADRGHDESTLSQDLVDLAFAAVHFGKPVLRAGLELAEEAYGSAVRKHLDSASTAFRENRARASMCLAALRVEDKATLRKGLRMLRALR
jgi:hypothetical protein